ncbi:MAG: hypothetical protein ABR530_01540 [Pyrinomonadaceae bacterium]
MQTTKGYRPAAAGMMFRSYLAQNISVLLLLLLSSVGSLAQNNGSIPYKSQEVSEVDGLPVLIKHLPDWESVRDKTTFASRPGELEAALGDRPILKHIDFTPGTEAVAAPYAAGKLVIVEFASPQGSAEADAKIRAELAQSEAGTIIYRRIGNYNVFVFDPVAMASAGALIDQVKYEKQIQWLSDNPFRISAERAFVLTTSDVFLSTLFVILIGMGVAIFGGVIAGYVFFTFRDGKRSQLRTFSDAGGMTRLNLDGFTPDVMPDRLLKP